MVENIKIETGRQGMQEITRTIRDYVAKSGVKEGLCTVFVRHTSASLLIQENADPDCRHDLENWMKRLVPTGDALYTHVNEGEDDMPAHIKSMLTQTSIGIPVIGGELVLGTWQGIFLWEHRKNCSSRNVVVHVG